MVITVEGGVMSDVEQQEYIRYLRQKFPGWDFTKINFKLDGDYVDISYEFNVIPFERIRRITGYLVGTMDRWNDAKRAEEHDRLKHTALKDDD